MHVKSFIKNIVVWVLTLEARLVLKKYKPKIVGVTGSVGKTSTKDAIFTVLGSRYYVRKSQKSFNTELGIPLTILGCDNGWNNPFLWLKNILIGLGVIFFPNHYPQWLVLEVGLDRPGDISRVVDWVKFDVVVYSRLSSTPVHVEFFGGVQELLQEKRKLIDGLRVGGVLITNKDDGLQREFKKEKVTHMTYGFEEGATVTGSRVDIAYRRKKPTGVTFRVDHGGASVPVTFSGVLGQQHAYPALAACVVGLSQNINLVQVGKAFTQHEQIPGRMRILDGINGSIILDDSYNASPIATDAALDVFSELSVDGKEGQKGRRICVFGDMTELGSLTVPMHEKIGKRVGQIASIFVAVGQRMQVAADAAQEIGMNKTSVVRLHDSHEAGEYLKKNIEKGDIILVKGSQVMRMEHAVKEVLKLPEKSKELLVRQETVWLKR